MVEGMLFRQGGRRLRHGVFTFVFKVAPTRRRRLETLLASWDPDDARKPAQLGFADLEGLHFASITLFDRPLLDPLLVIECNVDGSLAGFIDAWANASRGLPDVLSCCQVRGSTEDILRRGVVRSKAEHVGAVGLPCPEILASEALVGRVRQFLAGPGATSLSAESPSQVAEVLRSRFEAQCPSIKSRRTVWERGADKLPLGLAIAAVALAAASLIAPFLPPSPWLQLFQQSAAPLTVFAVLAVGLAAAAAFRWAEHREPVRERPIDPPEETAAVRENRPRTVQNHFSSLAPIKTGPIRWLSLHLTLLVIQWLAAGLYRRGNLGGIPGIHFAHWSVVDAGSSLLFVSNYDGPWESYLDDFIEKGAAVGLTAIWSHVQGFPASRWLVGSGAAKDKDFKRYVRDTQTPERIWYSAYPRLSNARINSNRAIVEALLGRGREPPAAWLARL